MHKFFTEAENFQGDEAFIYGDDVKHLYKVVRLVEGDKIVLNNYIGEEFLCNIEEITKQSVRVKIIEKLEINNESNIEIYLFQGLPKAAKMDLIVQKATELGVKKIIPTITGRVDVKLKGEFKKLDRLQRIANEACKQCKRTLVPRVEAPVEFKDLLAQADEFDLVVVPYENAENKGMKYIANKYRDKDLKTVAIVVGPEGGFEEEEINTLVENGAEIITLGNRILRTETAGFVCSSLLQYEFGDLGGTI